MNVRTICPDCDRFACDCNTSTPEASADDMKQTLSDMRTHLEQLIMQITIAKQKLYTGQGCMVQLQKCEETIENMIESIG